MQQDNGAFFALWLSWHGFFSQQWDKVLKLEVDFMGKHFGNSPCLDSKLLTEAKREFSIVLHSLEFCIEVRGQTAKNKASVYPLLSPFISLFPRDSAGVFMGDPAQIKPIPSPYRNLTSPSSLQRNVQVYTGICAFNLSFFPFKNVFQVTKHLPGCAS